MANLSASSIEARRLCKAFPDTPSKTLARRLAKSHKMTIEQARSCIRLQRGTTGKRNRPYAAVDYAPKKAGWVQSLPPEDSDDWLPFELGNGIKVAILADLHVPHHSMRAVQSAIRYCLTRKPDVVLINGDLIDFYSISKYQQDPSKRDTKKEINAGKKTLEAIRLAFPKARIIYKLGNHDERWNHWLWNRAPEISDSPRMLLSEWVEAKNIGVEVISDQRPIMCGALPVFHGHEFGKGGVAAPVNPARGAFLRTTHTVLVSHSHQTSQHVQTNIWHKQIATWSTGALCKLNPEYARVNKWNWGAAFIEVDAKGAYSVDNFRIGPGGEIWR